MALVRQADADGLVSKFPITFMTAMISKIKVTFELPLIHRPSKILNRLSKTMHSAASLRKKGKTLSLPLHAHRKHVGRRKVLLGRGIFQKCPIQAKSHISFSNQWLNVTKKKLSLLGRWIGDTTINSILQHTE